jgi:hypothetical protein
MNNWTVEEIAFRCVSEASPLENRLPNRIDRLTQNFVRIGSLSQDGTDPETTLVIIRESKVFIELTAFAERLCKRIDLDIDSAFELAQIQRQLSQWHVQWPAVWGNQASRGEIFAVSQTWVHRLREMSGAFV